MSPRRLGRVLVAELVAFLRRPLFPIWALFLGWNAWLMSRGSWFYRSVDTSVGTAVSWVNSEFQVAFVFALLTFLVLAFLVALAVGMPVIRDRSLRIDELLHATPLRASEYIWGKFLGAVLGVGATVAVMLLALVVFNHVLPDPANPESYGPLTLRAFVMPALMFLAPMVIFVGGAALALGTFTARPILIILLPISAMIFFNQFYWGWVPPEMDPRWVTLWQILDPSGFRWLKQTWLIADRGISFYNQNPIGYDGIFVASRLLWAGLGALLVEASRRRLLGERRDRRPGLLGQLFQRLRHGRAAGVAPPPAPRWHAPLAALKMKARPRGAIRATLTVARAELRELFSQPGLYVFIPIVFLFHLVLLDGNFGPFNTPVLVTSGAAAAFGIQNGTFWMVLLVLFYGVEALRREEAQGMGDLFSATPVPSVAVLIGKAAAVAAVAGGVLVATLAASFLLISASERPIEAWPFVLILGGLFLPTFLVWTAFVFFAYALTGGRWATYGLGAAVLALTGWLFIESEMTWVTNWPLMLAVVWSDMGGLELDAQALWLNRLLVLALTTLFGLLAVAAYRRRDIDRARGGSRLLPPPGPARWAVLIATVGVLALALGLDRHVHSSFEGDQARKLDEDYWRQNLATWLGAPLPHLTHVELELDLEPAERRFLVRGHYDLVNRQDGALSWVAFSGGKYWQELRWSWNGRDAEPVEQSDLYLFEPATPLAPGETARVGFSYSGVLPKGSTRNGGFLGTGEWLLDAGVVLTGRNPEFVPVLGLVPARGIDDDNRYEPRRYPPGFHLGLTEGSGTDRSQFTHRITVTAPEAYTVNATGFLATEYPAGDGRKTVVWETSHPLRVFNLIGGRYEVRRSERAAVFYHPGHEVNVDTMLEGLEGALEHYSEWFYPYPWKELRLSEFPSYSLYARGNPTNILFSEGIGFLTGRSARTDQALLITAHEAAHQWWGHIVSHGEGPGGIVLAEGAAHFATMMLLEELRGPLQRMSFARNIEADYGEFRQVSGEKPLAKTYLHRPADNTVVYNKGGWVFWMLMRHMGRDAFLAGVQDFFRAYHTHPDHPVIEDFVAHLRPFATDPVAYDAFTDQWFFDLVMPEYRLLAVDSAATAAGATVRVELRNVGGGRMPVTVAASRGRRFGRDGQPHPDYRDARAVLVLGPGEAGEVTIDCDFEPQRVVADPDVEVFQLQRNGAQARI